MALPPDDSISPFLNVFKDGCLVDSYCLDSRDSFVLGRHTDCDVPLAHPSISRHHLEIQLIHATHETRLTDMDSVHGTWVDGKQIVALTAYTVKEGVSIKLGASSRTYKVQWLHHPLPASSNDRSITPGSVDSDICNMEKVLPVLECSTKSNEACTESDDGGRLQLAEWAAKPSDSCSDNRKSDSVRRLERPIPSSCSKHGTVPPHIVQEIALSGGPSVKGIESFNANISLRISQQQQQQEGLPPLPPVSRRMPFARLSQNVASPRFNAKLLTNTEKKPSEMEHPNKLKGEGVENVLPGSSLWLRRCNSAPSPMLKTSVSESQPSACYPKLLPSQASSAYYVKTVEQQHAIPSARASLKVTPEKAMRSLQPSSTRKALKMLNEQRIQKTILEENLAERQHKVDLQEENESRGRLEKQECGNKICSPSKCGSINEAVVEEEYPSDKENQKPDRNMGEQAQGRKMDTSSGALDISRKPLQPLSLTLNDVSRPASPCVSSIGARDGSFMARTHSGPSSVVQNLDYILQKLKGLGRSEPRHEWHMVADTTCLTDPKSFKSLKLLEGIKEVRLIIPQIVIRELDFTKQKGKGCRMSSNTVLKWIEACMLKHPSWIHVQNSSENIPVAASTPPDSPHILCSAAPSCVGTMTDLMSPTSGDRVLNCALLFRSSVFDGQVALLTNDTALKIKAMAEGIVCEGATTFSDSLLSPYSERFLWAGSLAHGLYWSEKASLRNGAPTSPNRAAEYNKRTLLSAARGMGASKKYQVVENLKQHCKQAPGLKGILS